jgi:hypothetical protein
MINEEISLQVSGLLRSAFDWSEAPVGEQEVLQVLEVRIAEMLQTSPDRLMSLLYRLDVVEEKINRVLKGGYGEAVAVGLARLIWERQVERMLSRRDHKAKPLEDWEDWVL